MNPHWVSNQTLTSSNLEFHSAIEKEAERNARNPSKSMNYHKACSAGLPSLLDPAASHTDHIDHRARWKNCIWDNHLRQSGQEQTADLSHNRADLEFVARQGPCCTTARK